tara:strand:+ start:377 stop:1336 length:960 start_codon:yes stop_codon:yes gene_type:complete
MSTNRPIKLFIGSSTEYLDVAETVKAKLSQQPWISPQLWTEVFPPGATVIEGLEDVLREFRYAAFLIGDEDKALIRRKRESVTRDNVWFEAGLFVGRRGRQNTFLFYPFDRKPKMPSDLEGLVLCPFEKGKGKQALPDVERACQEVVTSIQRKEQNPRVALNEAVEMLEEARRLAAAPNRDVNKKFARLLAEALDCIERHGQDCVDALETHFDQLVNSALDVVEENPNFAPLIASEESLEDFANDFYRLLQRTKQLAKFDDIFLPPFLPAITRFAYPPAIEAMTHQLRSLSDSPFPKEVREHAADLLAQTHQRWLATLP